MFINNRRKPRNRNKKNVPIKSTTNSSSLHNNIIMPYSSDKKLSYIDGFGVRNNAGQGYLVYALRINDLFDPDPLLLSGSVTGFKEIMQFYQNYRVHHTELDMTISNLESFPISWGVCFSQVNLVGSIGSAAQAINALENGLTTGSRIISAKGGLDRDTVVCKIPLVDLVGDKTTFLGDRNYLGTISSSPNIPLYLNVIVVSPTAGFLVNGVGTMLKLTFSSHFFNRTLLNA